MGHEYRASDTKRSGSVTGESEAVSAGINGAYQQARDIEEKSNSVEFRLEALRQQFPDIAELVDGGMRLVIDFLEFHMDDMALDIVRV